MIVVVVVVDDGVAAASVGGVVVGVSTRGLLIAVVGVEVVGLEQVPAILFELTTCSLVLILILKSLLEFCDGIWGAWVEVGVVAVGVVAVVVVVVELVDEE